MMLSEIIEQLQRLNAGKNEYSIRSLRAEIEELSRQLEKIADSLIV